MDFMVPDGVRMDLADRSMRLPDEVGIPLNGLGRNSSEDKIVSYKKIVGDQRRTIVTEGPGRIRYLIVSNIGEKILRLARRLDVGMILDQDKGPLICPSGLVVTGSGKTWHWNRRGRPEEPAVQRPKYPTPRSLLRYDETSDTNRDRALILTLGTRSRVETANAAQIEARFPNPERGHPPTSPTNPNADRYRSGDAGGGGLSESMPGQSLDRTGTKDIESKKENPNGTKDVEPKTENPNCQSGIMPESGDDYGVNTQIHPTEGVELHDLSAASIPRQDTEDDDQIYYHESDDLSADDLAGNLAVLPDIPISTTAKKQHLLIGKENALPPAAMGVVCDIDVRNAKPIVLRHRKVPTRFREKVAGLIEIVRPSTSPWASPIVIVHKSDSVDSRLCVDYKLVNGLTRLMVYTMPLISDLLENLDKALWYCSLDMSSGFWVVPMTDRSREISAFITPFSLFESNRMIFGLKNAPQIYQRLVDNALQGLQAILIATRFWDEDHTLTTSCSPRNRGIKCVKGGEDLLKACDKWNLSISVTKNFWGMNKNIWDTQSRSKKRSEGSEISDRSAIPRIASIHTVVPGGQNYYGRFIEDYPIYASVLYELHEMEFAELVDLPFPGSLRSIQSFLGNYYGRFIEDYPIYAPVLYELHEMEFAELEKRSDLRKILDQNDPIARDNDPPELQPAVSLNERRIRAHEAFTTLRTKIAKTPILRHFDETRTPVDGIYHPVVFASRTLKTNELNYNVTEKEVLALPRILDLCYNLLVGHEIRVLTRLSTLVWLFKSAGLQGRLGQWSAHLSLWTLKITRCTKGEDDILGAIAVSITPRSKIDNALTAIAPRKEPKHRTQTPIPTVDQEEKLWVVSFDGSARVKRGGGAFSAIVWSMPGWKVVKARSCYLENLTVNDTEYNSLLLGLDMLADLDRKRLVIYGDFNLVIRQVRGEVDCKAPGLPLLRLKALDRLRKWSDHELEHVKRDWNGSTDMPLCNDNAGSRSMVARTPKSSYPEPVGRDPRSQERESRGSSCSGHHTSFLSEVARRSHARGTDPRNASRSDQAGTGGGVARSPTSRKRYLSGSIADLTQAGARSYDKIVADCEVDKQDLLFYCTPPHTETRGRSRSVAETD
ncbi:LOW QUALITY PROTEIN: reverse transcriptase [Phytophthora megakarya]|uniref:Reverse transcriptase n=1 Tax=Phytophthora megakarya TaxID=4795 RepID=A0A225W0Q9_9STRA|nr:LOW QUALITY PROTEIN: reverse transcriptase [Phytophthora megakarya]